jgi:hypothetical protein
MRYLAMILATVAALTIAVAVKADSPTPTKTNKMEACTMAILGKRVVVNGDIGRGYNSKECVCTGIGAGKDAGQLQDTGADQLDSGERTIPFQWCSLTHRTGETLTCGGTATTCP